MSPLPSPPLAPPATGLHPKPLAAEPSLLNALRAAWLFAWKTEVTLRRLPLIAISLLALPVLVYITTPSRDAWNEWHRVLGNPSDQMNMFARRLSQQDQRLEPEQRIKLLAAMREEYARAEGELRAGEARHASVVEQVTVVRNCFARIQARARTILDAFAFGRFRGFQARWQNGALDRLTTPRWRRSGPFYHWLMDFYFFVLLPLNCVRTTGAIIRDELQSDTLGFLISRPLSRARLLLVKYLSQAAWLEILALAEACLLFATGSLREIPDLATLLPLFLAVQFLAVLAWSALGTFLGLITQRYMAVSIVYGLIVEMGIGRIPTNINTLSLMRHLKTLLAHNAALEEVYQWTSTGVPLAVGALFLACGLFLALAAALFTFREYHHTAEMQK